MTALFAAAGVARTVLCRKDILPSPFACSVRIFAVEGRRQPHGAVSVHEIEHVEPANTLDVGGERVRDGARKHCHPILSSFAVSNYDFMSREFDVLHAKAQRFHDAHPGSIKQAPDKIVRTVQTVEHAGELVARQHHRNARGYLRLLDAVKPWQFHAQNVLVHEE
jgi:hypothetical protein